MNHQIKKTPLVALLAIVMVLTGCGSNGGSYFQSPTVAVTSLLPKTINDNKLSFDIGLNVYNPNMIPMPINSIDSNIELNGLSLLSASGSVPSAIPARGNQQVTLSADVGLDKVKQLFSTFNSTTLNYNLNGSVGIMGTGVRLPIQKKGQVDTFQLAAKLLKIRLSH